MKFVFSPTLISNHPKNQQFEDMPTPMGQPEIYHFKSTRFNGENFERWEEKMEYTLRHHNVYYVLTDDPPIIPDGYEAMKQEIDVALKAYVDWKATGYKCCQFILETLFDSFFNQFAKKTKC